MRWARIDEVAYLVSVARPRPGRNCTAREKACCAGKSPTIALDAPLCVAAPVFARGDCDRDQLWALCEALRFGPMTRRRLHDAAGLEYLPVS